MRAVVAVAVIVGLLAVIGWARAAEPPQAKWTVTLLASRSIDIGPRGPGMGDQLIRKWRLTDRDGTAVGFGYEDCRWFSGMLLRCAATYAPPKGTIDVAGVTTGDGTVLAITGGTGEYQNAQGEATRNGRILTFVFTP